MLCLLPTLASAEFFGDVEVVPSGVAMETLSHGYLDHRFHIENSSPSQTRTIRLIAPEHGYHSQNDLSHLEKSVTLPPQSSVTLSVLQPPLPIYGDDNVIVMIDGRTAGSVHTVTRGNMQSRNNPGRSMLVSRSLNAETMKAALDPASATNKPAYRGAPQELYVTRNEQGIEGWSDQWLSYSCFDGLALTADDMQHAPAPVLTALWRYVTCGGTLIVFGEWTPPVQLQITPPESLPGGHVYRAGFGACVVLTALTSDAMDAATVECVNGLVRQAKTRLSSPGEEMSGVSVALPLTDNLTFPLRSLFWIVLIAAIMIGPVNLWILARKNRQIWMLWTVPVLSLSTAAVVLVYALLSEGITPFIRSQSITILDEGHAEAVTLGVTGYYCPLTPSDGLRMTGDTEVSPITQSGSDMGGQEREMIWDGGQHLTSGWIASRVPTYLELCQPALRRERLEVQFGADANACTVVNGLGAKITRLWVVDATGQVYFGTMIPAGQKAQLQRSENPLIVDVHRTKNGVDDSGSANAWLQTQYVFNAGWSEPNATQILPERWGRRPNSYVAVLDGSPFVEDGLSGKANRRMESTVLGISKEPYQR